MGSPEKNNHVQKKVIFYCSELFIFFSSVLVFKNSVVVTFFFCRGIYKMSNLSEGHPLATAPRSQRYVTVEIQPRCNDDFNEIFLGRFIHLP